MQTSRQFAGFIGPAVVEVCRILDSDELRTALAREPELDEALAVTVDLSRDIFAHGIGGLTGRELPAGRHQQGGERVRREGMDQRARPLSAAR